MNKRQEIPFAAILYLALWASLAINLINDWVTQQTISPLSVILLLVLGGGALMQKVQSRPIIPARKTPVRFVVAAGLIVVAGILFYFLLAYVGIEFLRG